MADLFMRRAKILLFLALMVFVWARGIAATTNTLIWQKSTDHVSADIHDEALWPLLEEIGHQTGWHILVEPGADRLADVKFNNLPVGDALKKLLGDLNFALVPQTNGPSLLYVFMTTMQAATRPVAAAVLKHHHVANQLLVKLKPGADIDAIAKKVGARVIARDDKQRMYLLEFADGAATDAALAQLQNDSGVESVGYNNILDPPPTPIQVSSAPVGPPKLTLDPSTDGNPCNPVIGLIDTQVQSLGNGLDQFLKKPISVVGNVTPVTATITHGTAMAQTMLTAISQVTGGHSSVQILPVDVYESGDTTTTWDVALGVQAAVDNGATVLNMSLGGADNSPVLADIIQQAIAQGVVIFAAAGNTPVSTPTYPAALNGVNAVTALSAPGQLASYADYGNFVEMALPGSSYVYLGDQAYIVQGTSPATAYATGIAAGTKTVNCGSWSQIELNMATQFPVPPASN
ncbi:MAG: S8 family serine peptidase [Verrucomicrobiota bacterium]